MTKELHITDITVSDILKNMSEEFEVTYKKDNNQYCLKIPEEYGCGDFKTTQFDDGIGVVEVDVLLKKPLHFKLQKGVIHPIKFIFNRESKFSHWFTNTKEKHEVQKLESVIISSNHNHLNEFLLPANTPICIFSIEINRKIFEHKIEDFLEDMNEDLIALFRDVNGVSKFYHKSQYSLDISELIKEYEEVDLEGFMKSVYLESKAQEILVLQLKQYLDDLNEPEKRKILRKATIKNVVKAVEIIKSEIDNMGSVEELASRVNLNTKSLQLGFQTLYNSSVNDFIKNYRIEKAKELIENSDMNITEITYQVGINSRSYFSKLFKEKYNITPKQYYTKIRETRNQETRDTN